MNYNYTLHDMYNTRFLDGGPTYKQVIALFNHAQDDRKGYYIFMGAIHGVDILKEESKTNTKRKHIEKDKQQQVLVFGDPETYKNLSDNEKQQLTEEMMKSHKNWVNNVLSSR